MATPLPSPVHLIQNIHHLPAGCKVRVIGLIQSYDSTTGIMILHHRPAIDVPLPRVYSGRRMERKRPIVGESGDVNFANSVGASGSRPLASASGVSRKVAGGVARTNGISGSGTVNGNSSAAAKNLHHRHRASAVRPVNGGNSKPRIATPAPPVKPLLAASKAAVSALGSINNQHKRPRPSAITIPPPSPPPPLPPPPPVPRILAMPPPPPPPPPPPAIRPVPNYTLQVCVDLALKTISTEISPLPPIIEGIWVNVIGYKRRDGVLDAISIFRVKGKLDLEAYERAIVGMAMAREKVEWEVKEGIAKGRGLQGDREHRMV
ncbi:hypothetical protein TWF730_004296 [Orbilia blumenaviensis]|uniref:Uncharacterized protein n=1 Tax=Orbilia blumenaviensis TaxID=1796055 RepID=A0AAV9U1H1_9PEZI